MKKIAFLIVMIFCVFAHAQRAQPVGTSGTFTDSRDDKTYRTIVMPDGKTWMAENLNFATSSGSWCYENTRANCDTYGRLYDWNTARTVCPAGWHLSTHEEWTALVNAIGETPGTRLKSQNGWQPHSRAPVGTDEFGFSALPGGNRWSISFSRIEFDGHWWTATEYDATDAWSRFMGNNNESVRAGYDSKETAFSVRCVRD